MAQRARGRKSAIARMALAWLARAWQASQVAVIVTGALLLIAMRIPGVNEVLSSVGLRPNTLSEGVILPLILAAIFLRLVELSKDIDRSVPLREVLYGPMEVYPLLNERIKATRRPANKTLRIIGMNLKTAWPSLNLQINNGLLDGWRIELAGFVDDGNQSRYCNPEWSQEAYRQLASVLRAAETQRVKDRGIKLTACSYAHLPSVHGFRLGNGDLFISVLRWIDGEYLSVRSYTYDFIPKEDDSAAAGAMRDLFDSYWEACSARNFSGNAATTDLHPSASTVETRGGETGI